MELVHPWWVYSNFIFPCSIVLLHKSLFEKSWICGWILLKLRFILLNVKKVGFATDWTLVIAFWIRNQNAIICDWFGFAIMRPHTTVLHIKNFRSAVLLTFFFISAFFSRVILDKAAAQIFNWDRVLSHSHWKVSSFFVFLSEFWHFSFSPCWVLCIDVLFDLVAARFCSPSSSNQALNRWIMRAAQRSHRIRLLGVHTFRLQCVCVCARGSVFCLIVCMCALIAACSSSLRWAC